MQENKEGLELLKAAIAKAGYTDKVVIGMDVAASEFYNESDKLYDLNFKEEVRQLVFWRVSSHSNRRLDFQEYDILLLNIKKFFLRWQCPNSFVDLLTDEFAWFRY